MASDNEASCESDPNFAVICAFMEKFGVTCGLTNIDFLELQEMLENTQEVPQELIDLHIKLLRKSRKTVSNERWEKAVIKFCHTFCSQDAWEIERFGYKKARLSSKLRVLKELLEMQFDYNQKFKAEINKMSADELRSQPLGKDKHGHAYWFQNDNNCQIRVYKEDPDEETWTLVAKDREGLASLINELSDGDSKISSESTMNEEDSNSMAERPIIDTGQVDSSSDSIKKEESENSNEKEDSDSSSSCKNGNISLQETDDNAQMAKSDDEVDDKEVEQKKEGSEKEKEVNGFKNGEGVEEMKVTKKRAREDEEVESETKKAKVEVSEAIEEPLMLVKGQGSGADNKCPNVSLMEENCIVGEEIEEEVMYIYGCGTGAECETGNEDKTGKAVGQTTAKDTAGGSCSDGQISINSKHNEINIVKSDDNVDGSSKEVPTSPVKSPYKLGTIYDTKTDNKFFNTNVKSPTKKSRWDVETIIAKDPSPNNLNSTEGNKVEEICEKETENVQPKKSMFFFGPSCLQFKPSLTPVNVTVGFGQKVPQNNFQETYIKEQEVDVLISEDASHRISGKKEVESRFSTNEDRRDNRTEEVTSDNDKVTPIESNIKNKPEEEMFQINETVNIETLSKEEIKIESYQISKASCIEKPNNSECEDMRIPLDKELIAGESQENKIEDRIEDTIDLKEDTTLPNEEKLTVSLSKEEFKNVSDKVEEDKKVNDRDDEPEHSSLIKNNTNLLTVNNAPSNTENNITEGNLLLEVDKECHVVDKSNEKINETDIVEIESEVVKEDEVNVTNVDSKLPEVTAALVDYEERKSGSASSSKPQITDLTVRNTEKDPPLEAVTEEPCVKKHSYLLGEQSVDEQDNKQADIAQSETNVNNVEELRSKTKCQLSHRIETILSVSSHSTEVKKDEIKNNNTSVISDKDALVINVDKTKVNVEKIIEINTTTTENLELDEKNNSKVEEGKDCQINTPSEEKLEVDSELKVEIKSRVEVNDLKLNPKVHIERIKDKNQKNKSSFSKEKIENQGPKTESSVLDISPVLNSKTKSEEKSDSKSEDASIEKSGSFQNKTNKKAIRKNNVSDITPRRNTRSAKNEDKTKTEVTDSSDLPTDKLENFSRLEENKTKKDTPQQPIRRGRSRVINKTEKQEPIEGDVSKKIKLSEEIQVDANLKRQTRSKLKDGKSSELSEPTSLESETEKTEKKEFVDVDATKRIQLSEGTQHTNIKRQTRSKLREGKVGEVQESIFQENQTSETEKQKPIEDDVSKTIKLPEEAREDTTVKRQTRSKLREGKFEVQESTSLKNETDKTEKQESIEGDASKRRKFSENVQEDVNMKRQTRSKLKEGKSEVQEPALESETDKTEKQGSSEGDANKRRRFSEEIQADTNVKRQTRSKLKEVKSGEVQEKISFESETDKTKRQESSEEDTSKRRRFSEETQEDTNVKRQTRSKLKEGKSETQEPSSLENETDKTGKQGPVEGDASKRRKFTEEIQEDTNVKRQTRSKLKEGKSDECREKISVESETDKNQKQEPSEGDASKRRRFSEEIQEDTSEKRQTRNKLKEGKSEVQEQPSLENETGKTERQESVEEEIQEDTSVKRQTRTKLKEEKSEVQEPPSLENQTDKTERQESVGGDTSKRSSFFEEIQEDTNIKRQTRSKLKEGNSDELQEKISIECEADKTQKQEPSETDASKRRKLFEEIQEETNIKRQTRSKLKEGKSDGVQESVCLDSETSCDIVDEKDPLVISDTESKENEDKPPMSLSSLSFDFNESSNQVSARRTLRKRGREDPSNTEEVEETAGKRIKMRAKRAVDVKLRKSIEEQKKKELVSSDDDNKSEPQEDQDAEETEGKPEEKKRTEKSEKDAPVDSNDADVSQPDNQPTQKKTKSSNKNKRLLSNLGIDPDQLLGIEQSASMGVRQSRRIAQLKIKEEAERRKLEEEMAKEIEEHHKKKKSKKHEDKDYKVERKKMKVGEDGEDVGEEGVEVKKRKKKKKKKHKMNFDEFKPWKSSSDSSSSSVEEEEEDLGEESDEDVLQYVSDHEFSPESDMEGDGEWQPLKRARTARKESDVEEVDDCPCQKCGKSDHPEWILLCDSCDNGWHCSCLRPPLLVIPEGDWYCPPCQHATLLKSLEDKLNEYDKKLNKKEIEDRRRQRLAYVGISLNNVLPAKTSQIKKRRRTRENYEDGDVGEDVDEDELESSSEESESESGSASESGSDSDEPIYQLRQRRQAHSYRFNDYDDLINSAIQEEMDAVKGAGNQGRGKDIATIVNAEKEEERKKETETGTVGTTEGKEQVEDSQPQPPIVPSEDKEAYSDDEPIQPVRKKLIGRKKHRKLNSLDISSDEDEDSDEDFKGTSSDSEEDFDEDVDSGDSEDLEQISGKRRNADPVRRSTRARTSRYDADFIDDGDSEDEEPPRRKKKRPIWDETESEESDRSWGRRKKKPVSKNKRNAATKTKKKSKKKKKSNDDSDAEVYRKKKPKIKFGLDEEDDGPVRRTRGKKINYVDVLGSDSEEDRVRKPLPRIESEEEYVANEEDELDEDDKASEESGEESLKTNAQKVQSFSNSNYTPLFPESVLDKKQFMGDGDDEPNPIDIINKNLEEMNDADMEKMMEEEEYANKQLQLVALQIEREKQRKEREAKRLEAMQPRQPIQQTEPNVVVAKKRGRKPKSDFQFSGSVQEPIVGNVKNLIVNSENNDELSEPPGVSLPLFSELAVSSEESSSKRRGKKSLEETVANLGSARQQEASGSFLSIVNKTHLSDISGQESNIEIAAPPQPFSQSQPTPSVITRMLQSKPGQSAYPVGSIRPKQFAAMPEREDEVPAVPPVSSGPPVSHHALSPAPAHHSGLPGQYIQGTALRPQVSSPFRQIPPNITHYPRGVPSTSHQIRNPVPQTIPSHIFHSHRPMDPSPSGGGSINITDHNSPGRVVSPASSSPSSIKNGTPPPSYSRASVVSRFPMINTPSEGTRHVQMVAPHLQPPRPELSPYPYHYGQFGQPPIGEEAMTPAVYQSIPFSEQFSSEGQVHHSENSNSKSFDEESGGEFGGLVSYFSSQREDDLES